MGGTFGETGFEVKSDIENSRCLIVVPAFNEEKAIRSTFRQIQEAIRTLPEWKFTVICVDDGSQDLTGALLKQISGVETITHQINKGYGASIKTALRHFEGEYIFLLDADGTYPIEEIPKLLKLMGPSVDMVIGARKGIGIHIDPLRRIARWILRRLVKVLTGVQVPDLNSGMRVFRRELYDQFHHLLPNGFSLTTTITVASLYSGYQVVFAPIHYERRLGKSSIRPFRDFFGFLTLVVRLATYFEPLKFFVPVSLGLVTIGFFRGVRDVYLTNSIGSFAVIIVLAGLQTFFLGMLADLIVRRSAHPRK